MKTLSWFHKNSGIQNFQGCNGYALSRLPVKNIVSHRTERLRRGNLLCLISFLVSRNVRDIRGVITIFRRYCFVSQYQKNSWKNPSRFWKKIRIDDFFVYEKEGGRRAGVLRLAVEKMLSHITEKLRKGTFRFLRKILRSRNVRGKRRVSRFSVDFILSHITEKFRRGSLSNFRKLLVW